MLKFEVNVFHFNLIKYWTVIEPRGVTVFMTKTFNVAVNMFILYSETESNIVIQTKYIYLQHNLQYCRDNPLGSIKHMNICK